MAAVQQLTEENVPKGSTKAGESVLKRRLVERLEESKRFSDLIRVTQISPRHFRVNYISPVASDNALMQTYRITKSQFLYVEDRAGELIIADQTRR